MLVRGGQRGATMARERSCGDGSVTVREMLPSICCKGVRLTVIDNGEEDEESQGLFIVAIGDAGPWR